MCQSPQPDHGDVLRIRLAWLAKSGAGLRARTQAEYIYTAAAVAMFGAVCGGVAAQADHLLVRKQLSVAAAGVIILVTLAVLLKIWQDHKVYRDIWHNRAENVAALVANLGASSIFPKDVQNSRTGRGYIWSMLVLVVAAVAALVFCLTPYWAN